jgi:hypothetical protein
MALRVIDRFQPRWRAEQQVKVDEGFLQKRDEVELLDPKYLGPVAALSMVLFLVGGVFFVGLDVVAYAAQTHSISGHVEGWGLFVWLMVNVVAYMVMIVVHEAIHGLAFAFWGGKPYFGAKLPVAFFCGARNQVFRRNAYVVIGLAPLIVITVAGVVFTWLAPGLAAYVLLGTVGNVSGAAGDVWVVLRLLRQPAHVLVEDTESGYCVWELS